jgi:alkylation response protein AidB-like acyl-CoA dehydrogenase
VTSYRPPLRDIQFVLDHVAGLGEILSSDRYAHVDAETLREVLGEAGRFMAEVVAPTNVDGDRVGSQRKSDATVVTPPGFKEAYRQWVDSGFGAMAFDPDFGGAGFPRVSALAVLEMMTSANMSLSLCPLLTQSVIEAVDAYGSDGQRNTYLPKMLTGEWTGTMNLTEPQAGSDVGAVRCKAEPNADGSWRLFGQKIFITYGEHDLAENIIHLVLARTPGAPPGTTGLSMFVVPKFLVNDDNSLGVRNDAFCVAIEHKLGIHGSPTAVMAYGDNGGATGWLLGDEFGGMRYMFTTMNSARLSIGMEGLSVSERAYQDALAYAQERQQGTAVGAPKGERSFIIEHPDVRRLLMTQRAWIDGMRCLIYSNAAAVDRADAASTPDERVRWQELTDLLIPLSKALCTDLGNEMTSLALQVYGGMGYIEESGMAQYYRDARIAAIYEGTNGIQAADLVARKLGIRAGGVVFDLLDEFDDYARSMAESDVLSAFSASLAAAIETARSATSHLVATATTDLRSALSASSPYLRLLGTTVCGGLLARAALAASNPENGDDEFLSAKISSARFFGEQILPTVSGLLPAVLANSDELYRLTPGQLG